MTLKIKNAKFENVGIEISGIVTITCNKCGYREVMLGVIGSDIKCPKCGSCSVNIEAKP